MSTPSAPPTHAESSLRHRAIVFFFSAIAFAVAGIAPLRSKALSQVSRGLGGTPVRLFRRSPSLRASRRGSVSRTGYWHTEGREIVSDRHTDVRISGVNWSGFETPAGVPGGLRLQDYHTILRTVAAAGYNTIRIPLSNQMVEQPTVPSEIAFANGQGQINTDLADLDSMQILDRIIAAAGDLGLKVILDNHRSEAGSSAEANGLWYTEQYPEQAWIADWVTLARRYHGNPTVIGFDLRNEPHNAATTGACWDCGGPRDWHLAAQRAGDAILRANGGLLIFVEGVDQYGDENDFWGGNLAGVRHSPVRLATPGHLVYSPHVYGPSEYAQPWFNAGTTPVSLAAKWRRDWGFISEDGLAPVWIGEFGTPRGADDIASAEPGSQGQWFQALIAYLGRHPEVGWTYWGLNAEDRYGLLDANYTIEGIEPNRAQALASIRLPQTPPLATNPGTSLALGSTAVTPAKAAPVDPSLLSPVLTSPGFAPQAFAPRAFAPQTFVPMAEPASHPGVALPLPQRPEGVTPDPASVSGSVAEQVRQATQQALGDLPAATR